MNEFLEKLLVKTSSGIGDLEPIMVVAVLLISLLFGYVVQLVYFNYFKSNEPIDASIPRSFPVIAPAVTAIFWLIQFSLPLSLGLLGALSFVRFRTPIKRAEDIAFILLVIACSLAVAVQKFMVPLVLIALTFAYGTLRHRLPVLGRKSGENALITINTKMKVDIDQLLEAMNSQIPDISIVSFSTHDSISSIVMNAPDNEGRLYQKTQNAVSRFDAQARIDVFYPGQHLGGY